MTSVSLIPAFFSFFFLAATQRHQQPALIELIPGQWLLPHCQPFYFSSGRSQHRPVLVRARVTQTRRCGSTRWRTVESPDLPREGRTKVTEEHSPTVTHSYRCTAEPPPPPGHLSLCGPARGVVSMRDRTESARSAPEVE